VDFTAIMTSLKNASTYDLYRIKVAIQNELENPDRIKIIRGCFTVGDIISYFDNTTNTLVKAIVLEKNPKNAVVENHHDKKIWNVPYYMINIANKESDIHVDYREKPSKNNFKAGDLVGFNHEGKQYTGTINKLNHKTASLITNENKRWRVSYSCLFKVLEGSSLSFRQTCVTFNPANL
jgi:hypothetical protein